MASLADVRAKYPEYKDVDDRTLADALHAKFYSSIEKGEFDRMVGLASEPKAPAEDPRITALREPGPAARLLRGVPGLGGALDEINAAGEAALNTVTGGMFGDDYSTALEKQRAAQRKSDAENPTRNTLEAIAGGVALTPFQAMPRFASRTNPTTLNTATDAALTAGALSGLSGFTEGEGGLFNRLGNAGSYAGTGALVGGIGGAVAQQVANRLQGTPANSIARQAEDIGVTVPKFMEGGRSSQNIGSKLGAIPFVGDDINEAVASVRQQTGQAARNISDRVAGGGTTPQAAGEAVRGSMREYADRTIREIQERIYSPVHAAMGNAAVPLPNTSRMAAALAAEQQAAANPIHAVALGEIQDALDRGSLTFQGMTALRSQVGALINNSIDPKNRTARAGLQRIYSALTRDMEGGVRAYGGPTAQQQWRRANELTRELEARRDAISGVIGRDGTAAGEGIVDKIVRLASTKSTADASSLARLQRVTGSGAWRQLAGAAIERIGRNQSNEFSPDIFLKNYRQLSETGRRSLFGSAGQSITPELDRLALVAERLQQFNRLGNPSGSGGVGALLTAMVGMGAGDAGATAGTMLAGRGLGYLMSRPAVVRAAANYGQSLLRNAQGGPGGGGILAGASAALARAVAAETGEKPEDVLRRIENARSQ